MSDDNATLLTIYTEAALESHLINDMEQHGASGYTITNARGKGTRGLRSGSWDQNSNIRIEIICNTKLAHKLADYLQKNYYANYAMVTFISDIEVLRPEKFND